MKKYNLILTILILIMLSLAVVRAVISNTMSTEGLVLSKVNEEINSYKLQNEILDERFLLSSSFTYLATEAARLGFIDNKSNFVLTNPLPLASR